MTAAWLTTLRNRVDAADKAGVSAIKVPRDLYEPIIDALEAADNTAERGWAIGDRERCGIGTLREALAVLSRAVTDTAN